MLLWSDRRVAVALGIACVVLYAFAFFWIYRYGVGHGLDVAHMVTAGDSEDYIALAHTMLDVHRYAITPVAPPEFFRPPGYPVFLAGLFLISSTLAIIPLVQLLLTAYAVALVYLIGARYFARGVAVCAALLYMLDPTVVLHTWLALSEPLFMALFLSAVWVMTTYMRQRLLMFLAAGVLLGIATLVRPVGVYVAPIVAGMGAYTYWPDKRRMGIAFLAVVCAALVVIMPWMIRNGRLSGHLSVSSIGTYNLFYYNIPQFEAQRTGKSVADVQQAFFAQIGQSDSYALRSFTYQPQEAAIVHAALFAHPFQYGVFHILKTAPFFFSTSIGSFTRQLHNLGILAGEAPPAVNVTALLLGGHMREAVSYLVSDGLALLERLFWLCAWLLALYAGWVYLRTRRLHAGWVLGALLFIGAFALLTGPVATPRYRIPVEPFLFLLAAEAARGIVNRVHERLTAHRTSHASPQ